MGNFSGDTFRKVKHYVGVRLQQGVPVLDIDANEREDIQRYELQAFLKWFVGDGIPDDDGFRILAVEADNDFAIKGGDGTTDGAGRCLVEGWHALNESTLKYTAQPLFNNPALAREWGVAPVPPLTTPITDRIDEVYVDIWEREVDAKEDTELVHPLIGIETCVRRKREWVVRVAEGESLPPRTPGHVFYHLASLSREANQPKIGEEEDDIIDRRRQIGLNMAASAAEIADARGTKANLGNRLDESLTPGGKLRPLFYRKLHGEVFHTTVRVPGTSTAPANIRAPTESPTETNVLPVEIGNPDAFRLVSVNVVGPRIEDLPLDFSLDWHLRTGVISGFAGPILRTFVVLQNNSIEEVEVDIRSYDFTEPG